MARNPDDMTAWMDRAASGDVGAFARLAEAAQDALYRFALSHGLRVDDAAEATQETLLRAYRKRHVWRPGRNAMSWLYGFAMNVIREFRRRGRRLPPTGLDLAVLADRAATDPSLEPGRREWLGRLARAVANLPDRQREAVTCRHLREMSVAETAAVMGCAEGTVKAAVSAAMAKLRSALLSGHVGPSGEAL